MLVLGCFAVPSNKKYSTTHTGYSGYQSQPPPILKVYPFLPPVAGGFRGVRGGGYDVLDSSAYCFCGVFVEVPTKEA